jgi:cyclohexadienyl dehydratase
MKKLVLFLSLAVLAVPSLAGAQGAVPSPAPASSFASADVLRSVLQTGVLRVGLTGDYRPFSYYDPASGAYQGADVDAAQMFAGSLGANVRVEIVKTSWPTMTADLLAGKFDLSMGGVSRSADRSAAGLLSHTLYVDGKVALVRSDDLMKFATLAAIDQPTVTVIQNPGGTNQQFVAANLQHARVLTVASNLSIPAMIASGQGDVMITDGVEAALAVKRDPRLAVTNAAHPFTRVEKVYYYRKDQAGFDAAVDAWIDSLQASKTPYATLVDRWISIFATTPAQS